MIQSDKNPKKIQNHMILTKLFIILSYPLTPHLSSELWQYFRKFDGVVEINSKLEVYELNLPDLSFLKAIYTKKDMIKTKIFVN